MFDRDFRFGPFLGNEMIFSKLPKTKLKELVVPLNSSVNDAFIRNFKEQIETTVEHAVNDKWTLNLDFIFDDVLAVLFNTNDFRMAMASIIADGVESRTGKSPIVVLGDEGWRIHFEAVYLNEKDDLVVTDPTSAEANEYEFVGLL